MHWAPSKQKAIANLHPKISTFILNPNNIHRALQFDQKPYMKTFIETFVSKGSLTKTRVEKQIFQLIFSSAFANMCESLLHRSRYDFVTDPKKCVGIIASPSFTSFIIMDSNKVLLRRKNILLNRKIVTGTVSKNSFLNFIKICIISNGLGSLILVSTLAFLWTIPIGTSPFTRT